MLRGVLWVSVLLLVALLPSCITSRDINVEISAEQFAANSHVRNEFTADVGDKIRVRVASNRSTGFRWDYQTSGDGVLKEEDRDFEEPSSSAPGKAGVEMFTFEMTAKGIAEVSMEYSQPWEGGRKAEWTYSFVVKVE